MQSMAHLQKKLTEGALTLDFQSTVSNMFTELKESSKLSQEIENISEKTVKRNHTNLELESN